MFDSLFQFFFAYRPVVFSQGELRFAAWSGSYVAVAAAVVALLFAVCHLPDGGQAAHRAIGSCSPVCASRWSRSSPSACSVRCSSSRRRSRSRIFSACCWTTRAACRSRITTERRARAFVRQEFGAPDRGVLKALSDKFMVRTFRFSTAASRVEAEDDLTFTGAQTRLGVALDGARQELAGLPLAGLVVVSDGADTAEGALGESLLALKSQGIPVFTVGVGQETLARDIQIGRVSTPRTALKGTTLMVDVVLSQTGYRRQDRVARRRGRRPDRRHRSGEVAGRRVGGDGARALHGRRRRAACLPVPRRAAGRRARHREQRARGADRRARSARRRSSTSRASRGPRSRFIRRAVQDDPNLLLVVLQRTADNKYMRLGVDNADELVAGFPKTREELFCVPRADSRQHRSGRVHRRSAADDRRVRRSPRRRPADARRRPVVFAKAAMPAPRSPTCCRSCSIRRRAQSRRWPGSRCKPTRAGAGHGDHADRRDRSGVGGEVELPRDARTGASPRSIASMRSSRARPSCWPAPTKRGASGRCSPFSATVAARRSRFTLQDSWQWQMARADRRRGHDARALLAAAAALARRRRARRRRSRSR